MTDTIPHLAAIAHADRTLRAQQRVGQEIAAYYGLRRRHPKRRDMHKRAEASVQSAYDRYELALKDELTHAHGQPSDLHPAPLAHKAAARLKLWLRGGTRLGIGIGLGIVWATTESFVYPLPAREAFRHFTLHTCCAGGVADIKRANATASRALGYKRGYQLGNAEQAGYLAGKYAPMPAPTPVVMSGGLPV